MNHILSYVTVTAVTACVTLFPSSRAAAQDGFVVYDHMPSRVTGARLIKYYPPGASEGGGVRGAPPQPLEVRQGSSACYIVENPNPLLYTYSISTTVIPQDEPEQLSSLLDNLKSLVDLALTLPSDGSAETTSPANAPEYGEIVNSLDEDYEALVQARTASDATANFAETVATMKRLLKDAEETGKNAEALYKASDPVKKDVRALRAYELILKERIAEIEKAVREVEVYATQPFVLCTPVGENLIRVALASSRKIKATEEAPTRRPIDTLATFEVRPRTTKRFRIAPSLVIGYPLAAGAHSFAVRDSALVQDAPETSFLAPVVAQFRNWETPLWGTVGVRPRGLDEVPDLFLGLAYDFGDLIGGPSATLGAGVTILQTPVRLKKGKLGEALPPDVEELEDIVERKPLIGFGFTFTISSLELGGD